MDADINEAQDLIMERVETEGRDVIGRSGGPKAGAGFEVTVNGAGHLELSAGRYYVEGILCQLEAPTLINAQPDLPGFSIPSQPGLYLAYLDASFDHITALDGSADPGGGPPWRRHQHAPAREGAGATFAC